MSTIHTAYGNRPQRTETHVDNGGRELQIASRERGWTTLRITLPINLSNGNDGRGSKWFSSAKVRKEIETELRLLGFVREPFDCRVRMTVTRILGRGQRLWDCDSIGRGNAKELIDALVACGWFHDDKPRWIRPVDCRQDETRRKNGPAVMIEVTPVE